MANETELSNSNSAMGGPLNVVSITRNQPAVLTVLEDGDTIDSLARLYSIGAGDLTRLNGVPGNVGSRDWARAITEWVLHKDEFASSPGPAGVRCAVDPNNPNTLEPGLGFPCFVAGQQIMLPAGGPRRAVDAKASTGLVAKSKGPNYLGLLLVAFGLYRGSVGMTLAGAAITARVGPFK